MSVKKQVRITNAALDEDDDGQIILRGKIDPTTLDAIQFDDYQREILTPATIAKIMKGFEKGGSVPDVDLGMRGHRTKGTKDVYTLLDPVFGVDGQQRIHTAKLFQAKGGVPKLGAMIHFDTTKTWEANRFRILNSLRKAVSVNVMARNERENFPVVEAIYDLCDDPTFVLRGRVCWQQNKTRAHLLTAATVLKTAGYIHAHLGPGRASRLSELLPALQKIHTKVGKNVFRDNIKMFYQLINDCWGIRTVTYDGASHLKSTFLNVFGRVLSNHPVFWKGNRLFVEIDLIRKIKQFETLDPTVRHLSGAGGKAYGLLYNMFVEHINKGRRTKRLVPRQVEVDEEVAELVEA